MTGPADGPEATEKKKKFIMVVDGDPKDEKCQSESRGTRTCGMQAMGDHHCPGNRREDDQRPIEQADHQDRTDDPACHVRKQVPGLRYDDIRSLQQLQYEITTDQESRDGHHNLLQEYRQNRTDSRSDQTNGKYGPGLRSGEQSLGKIQAGDETGGSYKDPEQSPPEKQEDNTNQNSNCGIHTHILEG